MAGNNVYKGTSLFIKLTVAISACWYIYHKVVNRNDLEALSSLISRFGDTSYITLVVTVLVCMLLNWGIESLKWKYLLKKLESVSFFTAFKAILCGITVSIFTPNRAGEFAGRIFFTAPDNRIPATILTLLGSLSQITITLLMGAIAAVFYLFYFPVINIETNPYFFYTIITLLILVSVALPLLFIYFSGFFISIFGKKKKEGFGKHLQVLQDFSVTEMIYVLFLSLVRYLFFSFQFYLLLMLFDVNINYFDAFVLISLTFFAITAIPTIAFTELGIRGSAALVFIGLASTNNAGILLASFALWIVNIAIPALGGIPFLFSIRLFKQE